MRRTLQTVQHSLEWLVKKGVPVQLRAEWQETSTQLCDTGTDIKIITQEFPSFDFSTVDPAYPTKAGLYAFTEEAIRRRGIECRKWLQTRPERYIAVVSHSAFLRIGISPTKFSNADYRVFEFADDGTDELIQWKLTEDNGGGMGRSLKGPIYPEPSDFELTEVAHRSGESKAPGKASLESPS